MSTPLTIPIVLAASQTGLTLAPVLLNADGTPADGLTTTSLVEIGRGNYGWSGEIPDGHVFFLTFSSEGTLLRVFGVDTRTPTAALAGEQVMLLTDAAGNALAAKTAADAAKAAAEDIESPSAAENADAVWQRPERSITDKAGFALSDDARTALVQAIADASVQLTELVTAIRNEIEREGGDLKQVLAGLGADTSPLLLSILQILQGKLLGKEIVVLSPLLDNGTLELMAGDAYADARAIRFRMPDAALVGQPVALRFKQQRAYTSASPDDSADMTATGSVVLEDGVGVAVVPLTSEQTATLTPPRTGDGTAAYRYQLIATGLEQTLADGKATVRRRIGI